MNGAIWAVVGLFGGVVLFGVAALLYFAFKGGRALVMELREFNRNLGPLLSNEDIPRTLKSFQILAVQGEILGRGMEKLDATIQKFYSFTFKEPTVSPAVTESYAATYNEEDASIREAVSKARKEGIELDESRVSSSEQPRDVY